MANSATSRAASSVSVAPYGAPAAAALRTNAALPTASGTVALSGKPLPGPPSDRVLRGRRLRCRILGDQGRRLRAGGPFQVASDSFSSNDTTVASPRPIGGIIIMIAHDSRQGPSGSGSGCPLAFQVRRGQPGACQLAAPRLLMPAPAARGFIFSLRLGVNFKLPYSTATRLGASAARMQWTLIEIRLGFINSGPFSAPLPKREVLNAFARRMPLRL